MLGKKAYNLAPSFLSESTGKHPPPPPLPHYDPKEEAPKWDLYRVYFIFPRFQKDPNIPRIGGVPDSDDKPDWRGVVKNNIQPLDKVEAYKFGKAQKRHYFWFDTPDYADPFKKLWYSFKFFLATGGLISSGMAILRGWRADYKHIRLMLTRYYIPFVSGGMIFSTSVILLANLRNNKDDTYNYLAAGIITGAVAGRHCYIRHVRHTLFWVPAGCFVRYNADMNGMLTIQPRLGSQNWSLSGINAEGGIETGNFQLFKFTQGDPGRDVRRFA